MRDRGIRGRKDSERSDSVGYIRKPYHDPEYYKDIMPCHTWVTLQNRHNLAGLSVNSKDDRNRHPPPAHKTHQRQTHSNAPVMDENPGMVSKNQDEQKRSRYKVAVNRIKNSQHPCEPHAECKQ